MDAAYGLAAHRVLMGRPGVQLAEIVGVTTDEVRILGPDKATIMPEEALLSDHRVEDDAVLYFVRREGTAWEAVDIVPFPTGEEADAEDEG